MVTETFRGCTVSCTHCSRSEAKRWGSSARSQASCREQLRAEGAAAGRGEAAGGVPLAPRPPLRTGGSPPPLPCTPPSLLGGAGLAVARLVTGQRRAPAPRPRGARKGAATARGTQEGRPGFSRVRGRRAGASGPSGLTCCAGRTSRSGGPGTPGTARTTCIARSSPQAPESPGGTAAGRQAPTRPVPGTPAGLTSSPPSRAPGTLPCSHTRGQPPFRASLRHRLFRRWSRGDPDWA